MSSLLMPMMPMMPLPSLLMPLPLLMPSTLLMPLPCPLPMPLMPLSLLCPALRPPRGPPPDAPPPRRVPLSAGTGPYCCTTPLLRTPLLLPNVGHTKLALPTRWLPVLHVPRALRDARPASRRPPRSLALGRTLALLLGHLLLPLWLLFQRQLLMHLHPPPHHLPRLPLVRVGLLGSLGRPPHPHLGRGPPPSPSLQTGLMLFFSLSPVPPWTSSTSTAGA